jgi:transglutaminase-like putative cysteine protease
MRRPPANLVLALILAALVAPGVMKPASAGPAGPILHEPIWPDPREDLALNVALAGDLPAALQTAGGILQAPDPRQLPRPSDSAYGPGNEHPTFEPDRETRRPDVGRYDDPFAPATAPFKRLEAFDGVRADYRLYVRDERLAAVPTSASRGPEDESFYADLVVDVAPDRSVRIPSVGPGARIVRAHLGVGEDDVPMHVMRDGADNWFLQAYRPGGAIRARLVMQVVIARAAFGGELGDPAWSDLPVLPPLPGNVAREAAAVRSAIGVSHRMRPRHAIAKLVQYFRGFSDSDEPPRGRGSVYLDLALSKKGVCRHRAFAFLVTAQGLGIPTRMIVNEAHAWVEVHDGALWRRIDLGGAGRMAPASESLADVPSYEPPADAFAWPPNAQRGGDMVADARARATSSGGAASAPGPGAASIWDGPSAAPQQSGQLLRDAAAPPGAAASGGPPWGLPIPSISSEHSERDDRPPSTLSITVAGAEAHRGQPLEVRGEARAEGDPCPYIAIELWMRAAATRTALLLGTLATGDNGAFAGGIVVPADAPLGDYDVFARTPGDSRCGAGISK